MAIRLALAEDNRFLAQSIEERIGFFNDLKLKFNASSGLDLISKLEKDPQIDLILMDIQMPEMDGIKTTEFVKQRYPQIKVLMLTVFEDDDNIYNAIKAGANGYLLKEVSPIELHNSIEDIMRGGAAMTPSIALKTLNLLRSSEKNSTQTEQTEEFKLSKRELEILEQLATGLNYIQIADNLIISPATVRKHIENIYSKLHVNNKMEAVQKALKNNIL